MNVTRSRSTTSFRRPRAGRARDRACVDRELVQLALEPDDRDAVHLVSAQLDALHGSSAGSRVSGRSITTRVPSGRRSTSTLVIKRLDEPEAETAVVPQLGLLPAAAVDDADANPIAGEHRIDP